MPRGRYLVKVHVDQDGKLNKDWKAILGESDYAGQVEVRSDWPEGYGRMTAVDAGKVSVQDTFLTFFGSEAKNDSFGYSGLPGLRGDLTRYVRKQALLINSGEPVCLTRQAVSAVDQAIG